ncbi:FadR family transcriptional regulator [Paenibacillus lycopersici]|uniref:FadR family transcriptional regulator n=1 Tax=Paenibacillus lycopersici TaxID=2704462 RepID=A0A6C0FWZ1_9BACL|nr:FadR/GntR family transcriptional regulator [Paenibacillus lycopersici]QHT61598.1 FadR family transcriptional regulator [Paenibacillus lycopersici]
MLNKLNRISLSDQAYGEMERMIADGTWPLGARIPSEPELMAQLGVSRNTLREATRAMVHVGMLETKQGDGTFVAATSELNAILQKRMQRSSVLETLEVRHALDRQAASLACSNRTEQDLERIRHANAACIAAFRAQNLEAFVSADWQLHQAIVAASHNALLLDIYTSLFEEIQVSIASTTEFSNDAITGHPGLVAAISNRNAAAAEQEVDAYIALTKSMLHETAETETP